MRLKYLILMLLICLLSVNGFTRPDPGRSIPKSQVSLSPGPATYDQITQSVGNIQTTVDNYGYIGGYSHYGYPSGEWPRNSGHSYIAEIRYWMGAVTGTGDTLIANSVDDFQAIKMPNNGSDEYKIYLSTDTTRFYDYDSDDTTGLSLGSPAYGWRVWEAGTESWEYNQIYNTLSAAFIPGGPTSLEDSYYLFNDAASGNSLLGLEISHQILQWNYCYNEDFMYVVMDVTNTSGTDYPEFAFGLYVDLDVGGEDGTGENGRLRDAVVYDTANGWAYIYDVVGYDPGWKANTGVMGTKLLETPNNIGMTGFRTNDWAFLPEDDGGRFRSIDSAAYDPPLAPTDQYYIQCTRGINLTAGSTVRLVYAIVAGEDSTDFVDNADRAQELYDANYVGPEPPKTPVLRARAGDGKVYLNWDDGAETSLDPLSKEQDFIGYKLYRSDNQGKTWGEYDYTQADNCKDFDYETVASYRIINVGDPMVHSYVDTGLYNGVDYWYCLAAYDYGDSTIGVDPLQSGFGQPSTSSNVVSVTPNSEPAGYFHASSTLEHQYLGSESPSDGEVYPMIFDDNDLTGSEYEVRFEDTPEQTYWHLINATTGDTVLADQSIYDAEDGYYDVAEGIRVVVNEGDFEPTNYSQTSFGGSDTTLAMGAYYGPGLSALGMTKYIYGNEHFRSTFEFRYTGDSTRATELLDPFHGTDSVYWLPFELWNISTGQRVSMAIYDFEGDHDYDPYDLLQVINYPYDSVESVTDEAFPVYYSYLFSFDDVLYNPQVGDVFTVGGAPINSPDDVFSFKIDGVNSSLAAAELKDIKVVPNPYLAKYSSLVETGEGQSALIFNNLPTECTIRIYTLAGELVKTIDHNDGTGAARWNLLSSNQQQVASGIYIYHVESPYGEYMNRFSIIK